MDSYDIIVIILSVALAVSITVWTVIGILLVQVIKKVKAASDTAQHAMDNVEAFTAQMKNAGKATAVGSIIKQVTKAFKNRSK